MNCVKVRLNFLRAKLVVAEEVVHREDKLTLGFLDFIEALLMRSRVTVLPTTTSLIMDGVVDINYVFEASSCFFRRRRCSACSQPCQVLARTLVEWMTCQHSSFGC